jgi:hypothetical protein
MHQLGFDERYNAQSTGEKRPHVGFEGDVMSVGDHTYIHPQHFYDVYEFARSRDLLYNGATYTIKSNRSGDNNPKIDDTAAGEKQVPSSFNPDGTRKP